MKRFRLIASALAAGAAIAGAAAIPAVAVPAAESAPAHHFKPGQTYFQGHICMRDAHGKGASDNCWRAQSTTYKGQHFFTLFLTTSNPDHIGGTTFRAIYVGEVTPTWPNQDHAKNRPLDGTPVVNFELILLGKPTHDCVEDPPGTELIGMRTGKCSPVGQGSNDKWWSHMIWEPTDRMLEPNLTNRSKDHKITYCVTGIFDPNVPKQFRWAPQSMDTCYTHGVNPRLDHWWTRKDH